MTAITMSSLSMTYEGQAVPALDDVSIEVDSGLITVLLGPSGCGKTTLLKLVAGLLVPSAGDILFDGRSVLKLLPEKRDTVMVYQEHLLFPHMDVAANVGFGLRMRGESKRDIDRKVAQTLEMVRLQGAGGRMPHELSGGQQQRVALARALVVRPKVLLLDEPLSNLDAHLRLEMRDLIHGLQRQAKVTCIMVTHDQEEAVVMADKVALMLDAKVRQYARPSDFYERPASEQVARFFGSRNILAGQGDGRNLSCGLGVVETCNDSGNGPAVATIRPENIRIAPAGGPGALRGTVSSIVYMGVSCRLLVQTVGTPGLQTLEVRASSELVRGVAQGDTVWLSLPKEHVWVMGGPAGTGAKGSGQRQFG